MSSLRGESPDNRGLYQSKIAAVATSVVLLVTGCSGSGAGEAGGAGGGGNNPAPSPETPTPTSIIDLLPGLEEQVWVETGSGDGEQCLEDAVVKGKKIAKSVGTQLCRKPNLNVPSGDIGFLLFRKGDPAQTLQEAVTTKPGDTMIYYNFPSYTPGTAPVSYNMDPSGTVGILMNVNGQTVWQSEVYAYLHNPPILSDAELDGETNSADEVLAESLVTGGLPIPWNAKRVADFTNDTKDLIQLNKEEAYTKEQIIAAVQSGQAQPEPSQTDSAVGNGNALGIQELAKNMAQNNRATIDMMASDCGSDTESVAGGCFDASHQEEIH